MDDRGLVLTEGVRTVQELMEDGKRYVTISILKFVASIEHHGRNFTCQAQNSANRHPASVSTRYGLLEQHPFNNCLIHAIRLVCRLAAAVLTIKKT